MTVSYKREGDRQGYWIGEIRQLEWVQGGIREERLGVVAADGGRNTDCLGKYGRKGTREA